MTVEEVRGSLDLTDNGAIKNSIRNCLTVFQNDPVLQGAVRYNILTERIDIVKPLWWSKQTATLTDTDLNYLMLYLEDKYSLTSEKKIQKALSIIADSNKYHPIRDYLNGLEWDGTEQNASAMPCPDFSEQRKASTLIRHYGCSCWEQSAECSNPAVSLKLCSALWVDRVQESPLSSVCWQSKMNGSPMT